MSEKKRSRNYPPLIKDFLRSIDATSMPSALVSKVFDDPARRRRMKLERKRSLAKLFKVIIKHFDISSGLLVTFTGKNTAEPLTVKTMAAESGLGRATIFRILSWMKTAGFLKADDQGLNVVIGPNGEATLHASSVLRGLADSFFAAFGILADLIAQRKGKEVQLVRLIKPVVKIALKGHRRMQHTDSQAHEPPRLTPEQERDREMLKAIRDARYRKN